MVESLESRLTPTILVVAPGVAGDYQDIGSALAAAGSGDTIQLAPGTYSAAADLNLTITKNITIDAQAGAGSTFIDCGGSQFIFGTSSVALALQGLTVENCTNSFGAISISGTGSASSFTATGCVFTNNNTGSNITEGSVIDLNMFSGATATLSNCTFTNNQTAGGVIQDVGQGLSIAISNCTFTSNTGLGQSGVINSNTVSGTIIDSTFTNNTSFQNDFGGAISWLNGPLAITGCTFTNNSSAAGGGAIFVGASGAGTPLTLTRCTFTGNSAGSSGGGAVLASQSSGSVPVKAVDCVFDGNSTSTDGAVFSAVPGTANISFDIVNSSFFANKYTGTSPSGQGTISANSNIPVTITNSILYGDTTPNEISTANPPGSVSADHSDIHQSGFAGSNGNIDIDPLYTNPTSGDLHLQDSSPAAGAGTSTNAPNTDLNSHAFGTIVSMGAFSPIHFDLSTRFSTFPRTAFAFGITARALDDTTTITNYAGTVHFTSSDGSATLPADATLNQGTASLSATLNSFGNQTITATDTAEPPITGTSSPILVGTPPQITSADHATFRALSAGTFQLTATGSPAVTFSLSGAPSWLSINSSNQLVGTPPAAANNSTISFSIGARSAIAIGRAQTFTLTITGISPDFLSANHTTFTALDAGAYQLTASGSPAPSFSLSGAPSWLSINSSNQLVGTPPAAAGNTSATFTITASNGVAPEAQQTFTLLVNPAASISGTVFLDVSGTGELDPGEQGLAGRTVFLDLNHDGTLDPNDPTAVTDSSGAYTFSNLPGGSYTVRQEVAFDNVILTGGSAGGIVVGLGTAAVGGINFGNVIDSPLAPVVNASIFGPSNPDANTAYVQGLYRTLLGRSGSGAEVQLWLAQLNRGASRERVALDFIQSPEHRGLEVDSYYLSFLHRTEAPSERQGWIDAFLAGATEQAVVADFLDSPEYQAAHDSDALFAQDLYVDLLGRQASSTELANTQLALTVEARATLISAFINSAETNQLGVQGFYSAYLHRSALADPSSATWANRLSSGESLGAVQAAILGDSASREFFTDGAATVS
jgi:hypothetical protein